MTIAANNYFGKVERKRREKWYHTECKEELIDRNKEKLRRIEMRQQKS